MKASKTGTPQIKEPPLVTESFDEIDPDTGLSIPVTRHIRGVMGIEIRTYDLARLPAFKDDDDDPTKSFLDLRERLRDELEALNLPSDRTPYWVCDPDPEAKWRPETEADRSPSFEGSWQDWKAMVRTLTEPLSQGRVIFEFLEGVNYLLEHSELEPFYLGIQQAMVRYYRYKISIGDINLLAASGNAARKARSAGPTTRRNRSIEARKVIWDHAQRYWGKHSSYRNCASNTADAIVGPVNEELNTRGLLPRSGKPLRPTTIANHIRAFLRG